MSSPFVIPLAVFALVVLVVAITDLSKVRDLEAEVVGKLHAEELEHRRKMQELNEELERLKPGGGKDGSPSAT